VQEAKIKDIPDIYPELRRKSTEIGFTMPSDIFIGSLLKTLISSKPKANILELGTGIGLSLAWMIAGMDKNAQLITVDNDPKLIAIAKDYFGHDTRVKLVCADGSKWIEEHKELKFDVVFADAWPGKYSEIELILDMIHPGGFYVIDDMIQQPNWPKGHDKNVEQLVSYLDNRNDFSITKMNWSTGVIIAVKKNIN